MKKFLHLSLILTVIFLISFTNSKAGSLAMISADTAVYGGLDEDLESYAVIKNTSFVTVFVRVKMVEISRFPGHELSFCWQDCLLPDTTKTEMLSKDSIAIIGGQTSGGLFVAHLFPSTIVGESIARIIFYDVNDTNNRAEYIVHFYNGMTDVVEDLTGKGNITGIYPNPVSDQAVVRVNPDLNLPTELNIYNTIGSLVDNIKIQTGVSEQLINTSNLPIGNYFYAIVVNGVVKETRPFIVVR